MRNIATLATLLLLPLSVSRADDRVVFNRDIRPILADKCFACHGPDENTREGDLRLDDEQAAKADRDGHLVIAPGKPDESELLRRILSDDPDERMPPGSTGKSLTDAQVEAVRRWIAGGAEWQDHWSLLAPQPAEPPEVDDDSLVANDIDRFILTKLKAVGLKAAPDADRRTLLRRLYFDLIGLPPTAADVDAFLSDDSDAAIDKVVDRLLESKHFGERMAMYWLDVVRYADTGGYHSDNHRDVAPYRDYVIRAFNTNLPYNEFTVAQIAGDLLPNATNDQRIASGYNKLLQTTQEGGAQPKEYTAKYQADRVRNTAAAWLGLTMGCCECHDHKFDPLTMKDFYSFGAFFADVQEVPVGNQPQTAIPTPEQEEQLAELGKQLGKFREDFNRTTPELTASLKKWSAEQRTKLLESQTDWVALKPASVESSGGQTLTVADDLTVLASGENPAKDTYTVSLQPEPGKVTGVRLEALMHDSLVKKSLSRANGNFVLSEFEIDVQQPDAEPQKLKVKEALADFSQKDWPVANALDGKPNTGWAVDGHTKAENRKAVFVLAEPAEIAEGSTLTIRLRHESPHAQHNIGRFRLSVTAAEKPSLSDHGGLSDEVLAALKEEPEKRNDKQQAAIDKHFRSVAPELADLRKQIAGNEQQQDAIRKAFPRTLVSVAVTPRMVRILPRGNWLDDSGEEVQPATPAVLPSAEVGERKQARLDLGRWMASAENPLTARVFVNRLWKLFHGQGIVITLDDFGTQGSWPTHPELLDWLAIEFVESGWDVKHMVKLMVTSRTYRQSSFVSPELAEADPSNQWLARQSRFRLDAEMVRDNALAIAGLLSDTVGGASVKPYQPAGYWQHLNFPKRKWQHDKGENLYRRGLYTYWQRTFLHPSLLAFDAPSREECTVERPRSNTPLQALVLLNDPTYVEAARAFATMAIKEGGESFDGRLSFTFRRALGRQPTDAEGRVLTGLYHKHLEQYQVDEAVAADIAKVGEAPMPEGVDSAELAAMTSVARVILNLHETITRY